MAKLNARGRKAEVEVVREYTQEQLQKAHDRFERRYKADYIDGSDPSLTVWERCTRRLMSDGTVLEKRDVRFRPTPGCTWEDPQGRRHSYGWKVHGKLKAGLTASDFVRIYREPKKDGSPSSWTITQGAIARTVVISQKRIVRAIESGEYIGFCTECGNEQGGVEPDASGYRCESCGHMAVTGAENLLAETV